jgi:hypothetical protein
MPQDIQVASSLSGALAQNIPSGPAPTPPQQAPQQAPQRAEREAPPPSRNPAKPKALRPSEFMSAVQSGADPFDVDAPPEEASLGDSWVDHTQARIDEPARQAKQKPEQNQDNADPDFLEEPDSGDQQLEQEASPEAEEFDEFGNRIDRAAEEQARQEWAGKLADSLAKGQIPHDLLKDIPVEVPVNGKMVQVPFEEMRQGYMRQADYTRSKNEAFALRDRSNHIIQLERQRAQEWRDPGMLRQGLRSMVGDDVLFKVAEQIAIEHVQFKSMSPMEQQLHLERQRIAQERAFLQQQHQQLQQQNQQQTMNAATQQAAELIHDYMPRALKAQGVGMYPRSRDLFFQNIAAYCEDGDITPARAKEAAIAVRQQLEEEREAVRARDRRKPVVPGGARAATPQDQRRAKPGAAEPDVIRNSRGGGALPRSSTGQQGMRPSDIRNRMGY